MPIAGKSDDFLAYYIFYRLFALRSVLHLFPFNIQFDIDVFRRNLSYKLQSRRLQANFYFNFLDNALGLLLQVKTIFAPLLQDKNISHNLVKNIYFYPTIKCPHFPYIQFKIIS